MTKITKTTAINALATAINATDKAGINEGETCWQALKAHSITKKSVIMYLGAAGPDRKADQFKAIADFRTALLEAMKAQGDQHANSDTNAKRTEMSLERAAGGKTNLWRDYDRVTAANKGELVAKAKETKGAKQAKPSSAMPASASEASEATPPSVPSVPSVLPSQANAINNAWLQFNVVQADILKHVPKDVRNELRERMNDATSKVRKAYQ